VNRRRSTAALACALTALASGAALASAQEPGDAATQQPDPVQPQPPGPLPPPAGAPPASPDPALDAVAPKLLLGGRRFQRLAPRLDAHGTCSERCEFEASARVHGVPGLSFLRVVTPTKSSEGGTRMNFQIRVSRRAHKLMNRALRDGRRVRVAVTVFAYDLAANETEATRWIRVGPPPPPRDEPPVRRS
jgi:hypothetical protein